MTPALALPADDKPRRFTRSAAKGDQPYWVAVSDFGILIP
jgi:hypothetical protein